MSKLIRKRDVIRMIDEMYHIEVGETKTPVVSVEALMRKIKEMKPVGDSDED